MIGFAIAVTWLACGFIANRLADRFYTNAFPGLEPSGASQSIHCLDYVTGPIGLVATVLWLASNSYGFDGKKSPWRHLR